VLPDLTVIVPADYEETKKATIEAAKIKGPVYIRFAREKTAVFTTKKSPFKVGRAEVLREGSDVAIIGSGPVVYNALLAADELSKKGIECMVVNNHTIKPIDRKTIAQAAKKCGAVVTVEEHQINAGAGSAVIEVLAEECPVPVERVGMPDVFGESGEPEDLIKKFGMDKDAIIKAISKVLKRKSK
jgi:transketolase